MASTRTPAKCDSQEAGEANGRSSLNLSAIRARVAAFEVAFETLVGATTATLSRLHEAYVCQAALARQLVEPTTSAGSGPEPAEVVQVSARAALESALAGQRRVALERAELSVAIERLRAIGSGSQQ